MIGDSLRLAYNPRCWISRNTIVSIVVLVSYPHRWFETRTLLVHNPVTFVPTRTDNWPDFRWRCKHVIRSLPVIIGSPGYTCPEGIRTVQIVPVNWMEHGTQPVANSRTHLPFVGSMRALSPFIVFLSHARLVINKLIKISRSF